MDSIKKFAEEHPFITGAIIIFICVVAYKIYEKIKNYMEYQEDKKNFDNFLNSLHTKNGLNIILFDDEDFIKSKSRYAIGFPDNKFKEKGGYQEFRFARGPPKFGNNKINAQSLLAISNTGLRYFIELTLEDDSKIGLQYDGEIRINNLEQFLHGLGIKSIKVSLY